MQRNAFISRRELLSDMALQAARIAKNVPENTDRADTHRAAEQRQPSIGSRAGAAANGQLKSHCRRAHIKQHRKQTLPRSSASGVIAYQHGKNSCKVQPQAVLSANRS